LAKREVVMIDIADNTRIRKCVSIFTVYSIRGAEMSSAAV